MWYLILGYLALVQATTTPRSNSTDILEANTTTIWDVRTPPKIQSLIKKDKAKIEASHAGVAIPIDEHELIVEPTTKKTNFYKLDRPTTTATNGLSTWILLSGQSTSTSTKKPSVKPLILKEEKNNETLPLKVVKPVFKQRSTTSKPGTTSVRVNTFSPPTKKPIKLTKVKASLLQNMTTTTAASTNVTISTTQTSTNSSVLPVEAKEGDQELPATKKTKPKKKNKKNKRKQSKEGNNKLKQEIETGATQLYSYLRSEIIPVTVGVSLVGLLVTAGLASYYLQPFAALRRNDPVDRKDTGGGYYYQDQYSNSMPEEEAIGKVIAGMPESIYTKPVQRNTYPQYRKVDRRSQVYMNPYGTVEDVNPHEQEPKKFVVGNVPTQEPTPAVVPEHGPRKLDDTVLQEFYKSGASPRLLPVRKRREVDLDNEIDSDIVDSTTEGTTIIPETTPHNVFNPNERPNTFFELMADLFKMKLKLGMEVLQNVTSSVTSYANQVRARLDEHYRRRNSTKH